MSQDTTKSSSSTESKAENYVHWEYLGDQHPVPYDFEDSRIIELAVREKKVNVTLKSEKFKYIIDLNKMVQKNESTGKERLISKILYNSKLVSLANQAVAWKFDGSSGITEYSKNDNEIIEKDYQAGKAQIELETNGNDYKIDFTSMVQTNTKTKVGRKIQRTIRKDSIAWVWLSDAGEYTPYDPYTSNKIETEYQAKKTQITLDINNINYTIDFSNMDQTNSETNRKRCMKRIPLSVFFNSVVWEWESDSGFAPFALKDNYNIECCYRQDIMDLDYEHNSIDYAIDLKALTQTNKDTGKIRKIRRIDVNDAQKSHACDKYLSDKPQSIWVWRNIYGFVAYDPASNKHIEDAYKNKLLTCNITLNALKYTIDFTDMLQKSNSTKRARAIAQLPLDTKFVWLCETAEDLVVHDPTTGSAIEAAYQAKKTPFNVSVGGKTYILDFKVMTQTDTSTKKSWPICRVTEESSKNNLSKYTWQYQGDNDLYCKFDLSLAQQLEKAYQTGSSTINYKTTSQSYTVRFALMEQVNDKTKKVRNIRRIRTAHIENFSTKPIIAPPAPGSQVIPLKPGTREYNIINARFSETMKYATIKISRLENNRTRAFYKNEKKRLFSIYNPKVKPKTLLLFHGTRGNDPRIIYDGYDESFDIRYCSSGGMWGKGIYFACNAKYSCASSYIYKEGNDTYKLLVAKVIVGNYIDTHDKNQSYILPPYLPGSTSMRYDSIRGFTCGSDIFIIYAQNRAYPKYLIEYTTQVQKKKKSKKP